jgi:hypothetical protein
MLYCWSASIPWRNPLQPRTAAARLLMRQATGTVSQFGGSPGRVLQTPAPGIFTTTVQETIMAHSGYSKWRVAAITGGMALTAIEIVGAVGYLLSQDQPSYLVAGGAVVTLAAAGLPIFAGRCWHDRRYVLALLLWAALVPAMSVVFTAAVERSGGARDGANRDRQVIAQRIELKRSAEKEATAVADSDELAAKAECATGRGTKCQGAEARADNSRQRLEAAREAVAKAGVAPTDPQARRLAAILPVSEEAIALYQPIILPVAISAIGLLLIAAGAHQPKRREAPKRMGKRKRRRRRKAAAPQPSQSNVIRLRK